MKKLITAALVAGLFVAAPAVGYAAEDTVIDKAGDWFATLGKEGMEKDRILLERRTDRAAKRLSKSVEKGARQAGKDMEKAGKELEKAFQ